MGLHQVHKEYLEELLVSTGNEKMIGVFDEIEFEEYRHIVGVLERIRDVREVSKMINDQIHYLSSLNVK